MEKINKLQMISIVITALENGQVIHEWNQPGQCNTGIMAQIILNKSAYEINKVIDKLSKKIPNVVEGCSGTWGQVVNFYCPLTGLSDVEILKCLQENGLSRSDIIELESLSNPEILQKSGIQTEKEVVTSIGFMGFGRKVKTVKIDYFTQTGNFLKYLKAWKQILESENQIETKAKNHFEPCLN